MSLNKLPLLIGLAAAAPAMAGDFVFGDSMSAKTELVTPCEDVVNPDTNYSFGIQMSSEMCSLLQDLGVKITDGKNLGQVVNDETVLVQLDKAADEGGMLTFSKSDAPNIWHAYSISSDGGSFRTTFNGTKKLAQLHEGTAWHTAE